MKPAVNLIIIFFSFLVFGNTTCNEPEQVSLKANVRLAPEKKVYKVGDTLTLSILLEDAEIFDLNTGNSIQFTNSTIPYEINIASYLTDSDEPNFEFISDTNLYTNYEATESNLYFNYGCPIQIDDYSFNIKVVLNNPGIFLLHKSYRNNGIFSCSSIEDRSATIDYVFDVNSTNAELGYRLGTTVYSSESNDDNYNKGKFWFEVK